MRKLLLVLFLLSLTSNALAKVEIWKCVYINEEETLNTSYYKIDTKIPKVYMRFNAKWYSFTMGNSEYTFKYSREDDAVYALTNGKTIASFDLILKKTYLHTNNFIELNCNVIE